MTNRAPGWHAYSPKTNEPMRCTSCRAWKPAGSAAGWEYRVLAGWRYERRCPQCAALDLARR